MTNEIKVFENKEFGTVRTVEVNGEPWFVGKDVAEILGYVDTNKAVAMHVDEEDKKLNDKTSPSFGQRGTTLINESGLYGLILSSKLPTAKKFKHWVTSEILPDIRRHGAYMTNEVIERTLTDPDYLIQLATALKEERQARQLAEQKAESLDNENKVLSTGILEWADRPLVNALVRRYASKACDGRFDIAWLNFKKELLYKYSINLNARITRYLNDTGKKTRPQTLEMLDDCEVSNALKTIVSLCRESNVEIADLLDNKKSA